MNFYFDAAKVLDRLDAKQGSIKGVIGSLPEKDRKRTSALVIETLKYKAVLSDIITASSLLEKERQKVTSMNLALLLVHDLLLSRGIQAGDGPIKQAILRHKTRLHAELTKIKIKRGVKSDRDLAQAGDSRADLIPRYVRINRNVWSDEDAMQYFLSAGYEQSGDPLQSKKSMAKDEHIPDLLLFHPASQFHDDMAYKTGKIILQDKASCFPAAVLAPPAKEGTVVIDATAAPGNKTSHLSALMQNRGKVYAFEKDRKRFATLRHMLLTAKCTNVEPVNMDFLAVDPCDPKLLDPSCSGSGIVNRLDHLVDTETDDGQEQRLHKLAAFQLLMIRHAMKFPAVVKIVYSTCSVHAVENEDVVSHAMSSGEAEAGKFTLAVRGDVLPSWHRRGLPAKFVNPANAESVIRCAPGEDRTNGFFVSCFVKEAHAAHAHDVERNNQLRKSTQNNRKRTAEALPTDNSGGNAQHKRRKKKKTQSTSL